MTETRHTKPSFFDRFFNQFWLATSPAEFWGRWNPGVAGLTLSGYAKSIRWYRRKFHRVSPKAYRTGVLLLLFTLSGLLHDLFVCILFRKYDNLILTKFFVINGLYVIVERVYGVRLTFGDNLNKRLMTAVLIMFSLIIAKY